MRFAAVIAIWIVILGGLWLYVRQRNVSIDRTVLATPTETVVEGSFTLEITTTFSIEKDPFALETAEPGKAPLEMRLNGTAISFSEERLNRGKALEIVDVSGMVHGHNEIYVKAGPPITESTLDHGVRIRVMEDNTVIADRTVWSNQGSLVSGTISFKLGTAGEELYDH